MVKKIKRRRLALFGHVERMEGKRLPNAALHRHVRGERSRGKQRKRWMDIRRETYNYLWHMEKPRVENF